RPGNVFYGTTLADSQSGWILSPGTDRLSVPTGVAVPTTVAPAATDHTADAQTRGFVAEQVDHLPSANRGAILRASDDQEIPSIIANGAVIGEQIYAVPEGVLVTGALVSQPASSALPLGQMIQLANVPFANLLGINLGHVDVERLTALFRPIDAPGNFDST